MADAIMAEIEMLTQQVADLESRAAGTPEAEAVRARVMARFEEILGKAQKEFGTGEVVVTAVCPHSDETLRKAFDIYDADKSGFLENSEIVALAKQLGAKQEEAELKEAISAMDTSDDGKVSFDEFSAFMRMEGAGKMANKLRARLLKGRLGEQLARIKAVSDKAAAKSAAPPQGVERKFDVAVSVGGMQPEEDTAFMSDILVTATPRAEIPEEERLVTVKVTLATKAGVTEEAAAAAIQAIEGICSMGGQMFPQYSFEAQHTGETIVVTIKHQNEQLTGILDQMVFFQGAPGAASLQAIGKVRTSLDYDKLLAATPANPLDTTQNGGLALSLVATVSNDAWFENLVNTILQQGCDSDDEGEEGGTPEEKFAKLPFMKKLQKKVMPKLAWWMSGLRARFTFASISELLGKMSDHNEEMLVMRAFSVEAAHYKQAMQFSTAEPPEEQYRAIHAAVSGLLSFEVEVKAGFGDVCGTTNCTGMGRYFELAMPPYEKIQQASEGTLVKP